LKREDGKKNLENQSQLNNGFQNEGESGINASNPR
jgi:hypothetical protein